MPEEENVPLETIPLKEPSRVTIFSHPLWQKKIEEKENLLIFYLRLAETLDPNPARNRAQELARARDRALPDALNRAYPLIIARDLARELEGNLDRNSARDLARNLVRALNRDLLPIRDEYDATHDHSQLTDELNPDLDRDLDLAYSLVRVLDLILTRDRDLELRLSVSRLLTRSIILLLEITQLLNLLSLDSAKVRFRLRDERASDTGFSPDYLLTAVIPFLSALTDIQRAIDEMYNRPLTEVTILAIHHGSVVVDITGGIRDTVEMILDLAVPWRRENEKRLAELDVAQKAVELEQKEVEVEQAKVAVASDVEQVEAKARLVRAQAGKQELENQKTQLEIVKLALEMVKEINPDLPDEQRMLYAMKLVDPTRLIAMSPLELTDVEVIEDDPPPPTESESETDSPDQADDEQDSE